MPSTSSLVLLPPKQSVVESSLFATPAPPKDKSFEEKLGEARKKSKKDQTTDSTKKPASKQIAKSSAKLAKRKASEVESEDRDDDSDAAGVGVDKVKGVQGDKPSDLPAEGNTPALPATVKKAVSAKTDSHSDASATLNPLATGLKSEQGGIAPTKQSADDPKQTSNVQAIVVKAGSGDEDEKASADAGQPTDLATDGLAVEEEGDGEGADGIAPVKGKALGVSGNSAVNQKADQEAANNPAAAMTDAAATGATTDAQADLQANPLAVSEALQRGSKEASPDVEGAPTLKASSGEPMVSPAGQFHQALQAAAREDASKDGPSTNVPQAQFVEENHGKIISGVHGQLLPNGGSMQIRLDPPELGVLQVTVHMRDGVMTAAFETSNDDATHLLSHSLSELKNSLEASGVNVEKLHVQQGPRQEASKNSQDSDQQQHPQQQQQARQEQQRRELMQRMWRKLSGTAEPLDLVA